MANALTLGLRRLIQGTLRSATSLVPSAVRSAQVPAAVDGRLLRIFQSYTRPLRWVQFALILDAVTGVAIGYALGRSIDIVWANIEQTTATRALGALCAAVLAGTMVASALEFWHAYLSQKIGVLFARDVRLAVYADLLGTEVSPGRHASASASAVAARFAEDAHQLTVRALILPTMIPRHAIQLLLNAGMLLAIEWRLAAAVLAGLPALTYLTSRFGAALQSVEEQYAEGRAHLTAIAEEGLSQLETVRALGMEAWVDRRFRVAVDAFAGTGVRRARLQAAFSSSATGLTHLSTRVVIVAIGSILAGTEGALTAGALQAMQVYAMGVKLAFEGLSAAWIAHRQSSGAGQYLGSCLRPTPRPTNRARHSKASSTGMVFDNVTFGYQGEPQLIHSLSFSVSPGQVVALVGETGSGKSTVLKLAAGLYAPSSGSIRIDGRDSRERLRSDSAPVGLVPQDVMLFRASIGDNMRAAAPDASDGDIERALRAARADFVFDRTRFPAGLATPVGERGSCLSGGQKQRIAIARALLTGSQHLLLDEATSALDNESERLVQEALSSLLATRTALVVAHRLTTVQHATEILVLARGRIVERGTHEALMGSGVHYRRLWRAAAMHT